jgi:hypothetical protein
VAGQSGALTSQNAKLQAVIDKFLSDARDDLRQLRRKTEKSITAAKETLMEDLVHIKVQTATIVDENTDLEETLRATKTGYEQESY